MKQIAIFASGAGSNAEKIIQHFKHHASVNVSVVVCNKPDAGVINVAKGNDVPVLLIEKERFFKGDHYVDELKQKGIDFIILAGFLWKIPAALVDSFSATDIKHSSCVAAGLWRQRHVWKFCARSGDKKRRKQKWNYHSCGR